MIWWALIVIGGAAVAAGTLMLRDRMPPVPRIAMVMGGAAAVGIGATGVVGDASPVEWVLTPLVLAALSLLHDRLVFSGDGPRRT